MRKNHSHHPELTGDVHPAGILAIRSLHRCLLFAALLLTMPILFGCHSAHVNATVSNHSSATISVVQVEYPSASFGTQSIAPGQDFNYRFKVLGSGTLKITYTDTARVEHQFIGPSLKEGDDGALAIVVGAGKPDWNLKLASH